MSTFFVAYKNSQVHCIQWGKGNEWLICFHGFGENAESFQHLATALAEKYTVIAIDLPLHGQTVWNEEMTCTPEDIMNIIYKLPGLEDCSFSLAGYSMGGRVALAVYQQMPQRIQQLILLAPDGIKVNGWYWLATQTAMGNRLFRYCMKDPWLFFGVTSTLKSLGIINIGVYNYVQKHLQESEMRSRLYAIWTLMRKIRPDIPVVQSLINVNQTPVILLYGKNDNIIRFATGERFKKGIDAFCHLHVLHCGHRMLHEKNTSTIAALL
ncbi:MAG TPA: alpha/beta hydrolase [Agriterribacter sp.]|nr:alpha/beta hydrolase [Agriterribacter sp.]